MPLAGSYGQLLLRGLLAGLIAGLLAGAVAYVLGETHIDAAIALEEAHAAAGEPHEELVSRGGQQAGLFLATGLAGVALGALFASVIHVGRRYLSLAGPALALFTGFAGWLAIAAVPFFKYPANPPAVGDAATIGDRTWLWLAAVLLGITAVGAGLLAWKALPAPDMLRATAAGAAFTVVVAAGYLLLPGINEVPADFPATLLWRFRAASLATQATLWLGLGLVFAGLTELRDRQQFAPAVAAS